ncbi:hypothetical protein CFHF_20990 [Caulobacter flavus]|uniref:Uncharacterized protein n=1 Tax=Caulobacter flavus TaxID=1679497 RepID=A0A2N5CNI4_9CAUL|nr:hypothetical protein [Caulobacter flavus]PLR08052.1 hypothetical protein CFHF_20990 [Caulobacter flavus]
MATPQKKSTTRKAGSTQRERPIVYRGIKIQPMLGERSPLAKSIREGFRAMSDTTRAPATED